MAFKDLTVDLYDNQIRIEYKDAAHRYYRRNRLGSGLYGPAVLTRGVTTMMDNVLEKKSLMTWPMGVALRELFGFYDFDGDNGRVTGFSKGVGALWDVLDGQRHLRPLSEPEALTAVLDASKGWTRKQRKGADIGSIVHDAIEHHIKGQPFSIAGTYRENFNLKVFENDQDRERELKQIDSDVEKAEMALGAFKQWWAKTSPELLGAEDLVYSLEMDYCGTFDALLRINGKVVLCDWKTTNASKKIAPQGVYYSYFLQLGAYASAWQEMGNGKIDDLLVVSARKDGGFDTKLASEIGLSVEDCIKAWRALFELYKFITSTNRKLIGG